jgi:hypothetical protein
MNSRRTLVPLVVLAAITCIASGCGNSTGSTRTSGGGAPQTTVADPQQRLEAAVRQAISLDHREAVRALWTNQVPARPAATGGPALVQWRSSTAVARKQGIRVRLLSERFRIVSITLDPSYSSAVAVIHDDQRAQLDRADGKPLGRSVAIHERVRLELHRAGHAERFVVWRVVALPR